jgi:hypothetical protein
LPYILAAVVVPIALMCATLIMERFEQRVWVHPRTPMKIASARRRRPCHSPRSWSTRSLRNRQGRHDPHPASSQFDRRRQGSYLNARLGRREATSLQRGVITNLALTVLSAAAFY